MTDELEDLKKKVEATERKTAIWRSQVVVLLVVFLTGWVASSFWMKRSLEARVERTERAMAEKGKTVEAENFVVRDSSGKRWAVLGLREKKSDGNGGDAYLSFYGEKGSELLRLNDRSLQLYRTDKSLGAVLFASNEESGVLFTSPAKEAVLGAWVDEKGVPKGRWKPLQTDQWHDLSDAGLDKGKP